MHDVFLYITFFSGLLPLLLYLLPGRTKILDAGLKGIRPFLWLTAGASLYEPIVTLGLKVDSLHWFRIYDILEFSALYYFFRQLFPKPKCRKALLFFGIPFMAGMVFVYCTGVSQLLLESVYCVFIFLFVLLFASYWMWTVFSREDIPSLWKEPAFDFLAGFMLYYASTFFLFLYSEVIFFLNIVNYEDYWLLNVAATFILQIFLIIGVWNGKRI